MAKRGSPLWDIACRPWGGGAHASRSRFAFEKAAMRYEHRGTSRSTPGEVRGRIRLAISYTAERIRSNEPMLRSCIFWCDEREQSLWVCTLAKGLAVNIEYTSACCSDDIKCPTSYASFSGQQPSAAVPHREAFKRGPRGKGRCTLGFAHFSARARTL